MSLGCNFMNKPSEGGRSRWGILLGLVTVASFALHSEATGEIHAHPLRNNKATEQHEATRKETLTSKVDGHLLDYNETIISEVDGLPLDAAAFNEEGLGSVKAKAKFDEEGKQIEEALDKVKEEVDGMGDKINAGNDKNVEAFKDVQAKTQEYSNAVQTLGKTVQKFGGTLRKVVEGFKQESRKQAELANDPIDNAIQVLMGANLDQSASENQESASSSSETKASSSSENQERASENQESAIELSTTGDTPNRGGDESKSPTDSSSFSGHLASVMGVNVGASVGARIATGAKVETAEKIRAKVRHKLHDELEEEIEQGLDDSLPLTNSTVLLQLQGQAIRNEKPSTKLKLDASELLLASENGVSELQHENQVTSQAQDSATNQRSGRQSFLQANVPLQ